MKKKLLMLIVIMLAITTLTACGGSNGSGLDKTTSIKSTNEPLIPSGTSNTTKIENIESENNDDFIEMAREMYLQYNDDEEYFDRLVSSYSYSSNTIYETLGVGGSSYSYAYYNGTIRGEYMDTSSYTCDRNGRKLQEFASELASNVNATTDVVVKKINGLNIAHFTTETEGARGDYNDLKFYYNEVYVVDDIKDDKFLVAVYSYYNEKKINDNSKNPSVMTSDHSEYFLVTAVCIQEIRENKLFEVEAYDFDENVSSNIAFNFYAYDVADLVDVYSDYDCYISSYERNVPIEGSDEYITTKGWGAKELTIIPDNIDYCNELAPRLFGDYRYAYYFDTLKIDSDVYNEERDSLYNEYSCEEVNINGLNGLLYSGEDGYKIYWFENNGYAVEIIFAIYDTCEYAEFNNSIENEFNRFLNGIHIVER